MKSAQILVAASIALLLAHDLRAQRRVYAGPVAGYEFSVPLLLQRNEGAINYEPGFGGTGESYSHSFIAGAQLFSPEALSEIFGYSGRLSLYATTANFTSDAFVPDVNLDTAQTVFDPSRYRQVSVDLTAATVVADFQARATIAGTLTTGLGLWASARLTGQFMRTERPMLIPPDIDPEDATIVTGGSRIAALTYSYGLLGSIATRHELSQRVVLMPEITSRLDAVALRKGLGVRAFTIGAGVSVLFDASDVPYAASTTEPLGAVSAPDTVARSARLEARVSLYADDVADGAVNATVRGEDVINRLYFSIPRALDYDANAFDIPGGFTRISRDEADAFSSRMLAGLDVAGHYRHVLNIIGHRLRSTPRATLALTGIRTDLEPAPMARVRAEYVRRYLADVWRIDSARIKVRERTGNAPSLELDGGMQLLRLPSLTQWRSRRFRMPSVGMEREITADAGVRRWTLELAHGERFVGRFVSDSSTVDPSFDLRFVAGDDVSAIAPIVASLHVEDSLGQSITVRDTLDVIRDTSAPRAVRHERLEFVAFVNDDDSVATRARMLSTAQLAGRALRDGADVLVRRIGGRGRASARSQASRLAQDLLAVANERGVRLDRIVADAEQSDQGSLAAGVRVVVEQASASVDDVSDERDSD